MNKQRIRVYADTSVFDGVFDARFSVASLSFFEKVRGGLFSLILTDVVRREISPAPENVKTLFEEMLTLSEVLPISDEALTLRDAYLKAGILGQSSLDDALHVALASSNHCQMIISWNFKHIVNFQKIPLFNAVNTLQGYSAINIFSPLEVTYDKD